MNQAERWELTANQYLALPMISGASGAIHNLNVLLRAAFGLVEWSGDDRAGRALLTPELLVDGKPVVLENLVWERLDRWVPRFKLGIKDGLTITATLCAPTGYDAARRGAFYQFELENRSSSDHRVSVALVGEWAVPSRSSGPAGRSQPSGALPCRPHDRDGTSSWQGRPPLRWAWSCSGPMPSTEWKLLPWDRAARARPAASAVVWGSGPFPGFPQPVDRGGQTGHGHVLHGLGSRARRCAGHCGRRNGAWGRTTCSRRRGSSCRA